jgi:hypothetical protein
MVQTGHAFGHARGRSGPARRPRARRRADVILDVAGRGRLLDEMGLAIARRPSESRGPGDPEGQVYRKPGSLSKSQTCETGVKFQEAYERYFESQLGITQPARLSDSVRSGNDRTTPNRGAAEVYVQT